MGPRGAAPRASGRAFSILASPPACIRQLLRWMPSFRPDPAPATRIPTPSAVVHSPREGTSVHRLEHLKRQVRACFYEVGLMLRLSHGSGDRADLGPEHQAEQARHRDGNCNGNEPAHVNHPRSSPQHCQATVSARLTAGRPILCDMDHKKSLFRPTHSSSQRPETPTIFPLRRPARPRNLQQSRQLARVRELLQVENGINECGLMLLFHGCPGEL